MPRPHDNGGKGIVWASPACTATRQSCQQQCCHSTNTTAVTDDPGPQGPFHTYLPGRVRNARTFQYHAKSTEHMVQGLRLQKKSFQVYCDGHICMTRDEMHLIAYWNTRGADSTCSGDMGGGVQYHLSLTIRGG